MGVDVPLSCKCGKVRGMAHDLSPASTNHVVCSCRYCQLYAHYLDHADEMLDGNGGSHIFQMEPAKFEITDGQDYVTSVAITPKGPYRWHTACCKTPLGNSFPRAGIPFLGVLPMCIGQDGTSSGFEALVGPSKGHVNQPRKVPLGEQIGIWWMLLRFATKLLRWRLLGGRSCKPFFEENSGNPIAVPRRLNKEDYDKLKLKAGL